MFIFHMQSDNSRIWKSLLSPLWVLRGIGPGTLVVVIVSSCERMTANGSRQVCDVEADVGSRSNELLANVYTNPVQINAATGKSSGWWRGFVLTVIIAAGP